MVVAREALMAKALILAALAVHLILLFRWMTGRRGAGGKGAVRWRGLGARPIPRQLVAKLAHEEHRHVRAAAPRTASAAASPPARSGRHSAPPLWVLRAADEAADEMTASDKLSQDAAAMGAPVEEASLGDADDGEWEEEGDELDEDGNVIPSRQLHIDGIHFDVESNNAMWVEADGISPAKLEAGVRRLVETLSEFAVVKRLQIPRDENTGFRPKDEAIVTFSDKAGAAAVLKWLNGKEYDGQTLTVTYSTERRDRVQAWRANNPPPEVVAEEEETLASEYGGPYYLRQFRGKKDREGNYTETEVGVKGYHPYEEGYDPKLSEETSEWQYEEFLNRRIMRPETIYLNDGTTTTWPEYVEQYRADQAAAAAAAQAEVAA